MSKHLLVCRVTWMDHYQGVSANDVPRGGGAYVQEKGFGHEAFNFSAYRGEYFGYVQSMGKGVNLARFGCPANAESLKGVTVIWVATHPVERGCRVIGWYTDATVFAEYRDSPTPTRRLPNGQTAGFLVRARNGMLLGRDERTCVVPRGTATISGMGQSNIWYPQPEDGAPLLAYVKSEGRTPQIRRPRQAKPHLQDVERRIRIERTAMDASAAWFVGNGYDVTDVAMQNLGWDLEGLRGRSHLRIEVKGTSAGADDAVVEVTPNEFAKMHDASLRDSYRLCIVSNCEQRPDVEVFAWSAERGVWSSSDGTRTLRVDQIVAARIHPVGAFRG